MSGNEIERKNLETVQFPDFEGIVIDCRRKMIKKFEEYGNSWIGYTDFDFWEKRLLKEVEEFLISIRYGETSFEGQRLEGIDIINVVSMIIENIRDINMKHYGRNPKEAVHTNWRYS